MEGDRSSVRNNPASSDPVGADTYSRVNIPNDGINSLNKNSKREKINSVVILVVGISALLFGYYQLASNINNPFSFLGNASPGNSSQTDSQLMAINSLKNQDTDSDGLSDYDEIYTHKTSIYLDDSDGDGTKDGQEVKQGADPNCPEGKTCFGSGLNNSTSSSGVVPTFQSAPPNQSTAQITIQDIRKALVQGGLTQEEVDAMTDQDIIDTYQQVLSENPELANQIVSNGVDSSSLGMVSSSSNRTTTSSKPVDLSSLNVDSMDDLKALTGAQIRELMIKNGAPKTLLDSISDDELKQMFLDKLNSTATTN